jgi:hypothetical protein
MARERPIIFSAEMVRAILDGPKTQTRRVIKPQPKAHDGPLPADCVAVEEAPGLYSIKSYRDGQKRHVQRMVSEGMPRSIIPHANAWEYWRGWCPYGTPGDFLWVKEGHGFMWDDDLFACVVYRADGTKMKPTGLSEEDGYCFADLAERGDAECGWKWRPSIHMYRWASRITLEVTEVRVERVLDISKEDAIAEGLRQNDLGQWLPHYPSAAGWEDPRQAFWGLWDSINEKRGYASMTVNPWVWVVSFRKV